MELVELRVRTKIPQEELDKKVGRIIGEKDYNVRLTGATRVVGPSGRPLVIYLPKALSGAPNNEHYPVLHKIRATTNNRGLASGSETYVVGNQSASNAIASTIIGAFDGSPSTPRFPYCRTTAWTGQHTEQFRSLYPLFNRVASLFKRYVPDRYATQMARAEVTDRAWRVGDTPFTTMTVNNTYPTGVHTDKGDLDEGYSCLAVWRRGQYTGGHLVLPEYRIAIDLQDGDLVLMDAHQYHGNTQLELQSEDAERISLVLYYRTEMLACGTLMDEATKEVAAKKKTIKAHNPSSS
mgnify:CR=1 FL=1